MVKKKSNDIESGKYKTELWPINKFIPYDKNPRKNDHVIDKLVNVIKEFGFKVPIIAKSDGLIVDGHMRLKAAKKLNLKELPVILADDLTEAQIKGFRLAANKSQEWASWDDDLLKLELEDLKELDFDLGLIGFEDFKLDDNINPIDMPELSSEDKKPIQQITFTLHDDQAESVKFAIEKSKKMGEFGDTGNENSNGNALARICEMFL